MSSSQYGTFQDLIDWALAWPNLGHSSHVRVIERFFLHFGYSFSDPIPPSFFLSFKSHLELHLNFLALLPEISDEDIHFTTVTLDEFYVRCMQAPSTIF